ncbi:MAG: lysophospholipid acyltransferase family protein [Clostridium sp.]
MFRSIMWYSNFGLTLLGTVPKMLKVKNLDKKLSNNNEINMEKEQNERDALVYSVVSKWAANKVTSSGSSITVHGEDNIPNNETVLFISNHQSNFDIPILLSYINVQKGFVAKQELSKVPVLKTWMKNINCVFMDRSNLRNSAQAISNATKLLKNGRSMVIFPEGTRSCGNHLLDFKPGSFKLATKSKVSIVPITIKNSYKIMEENNNRITPANVDLYIHPPISTKDLSREDEDLLPSKVKTIIQSKLS